MQQVVLVRSLRLHSLFFWHTLLPITYRTTPQTMRIYVALALLLGTLNTNSYAASVKNTGPISQNPGVKTNIIEKDTSVYVAYRMPSGSRFGKLKVFLGQLFEQDQLAFEQDCIRTQKAVSEAAAELKKKRKSRKHYPPHPALLTFISRGKWS